ncbi:MAG: outer membrane beta-barrel protein [Reichenbachiella sp.]
MIIKILPILSAFIFSSAFSFAQKTEYGLAIGGLSYSGDLHRGYDVLNQNLGLQGIYRINLSEDVAVKFGLLYGSVKGDDSEPFDALGRVRNASFQRSFLEGSAVFEYHFIDYKHKNSTIKFSPYLFGGIGFTNFFNLDRSVDDFSSIQPVIPFGLGMKHLVGKQFTMSLEFGARKTFFDGMDGISAGDTFDKSGFQFGNPSDNDWYHFIGVSFSYILYKIPCTYRYVPNKSLHRK